MTEPWWDIIPRKREAADVLLCDESGRPMIVQNSWNDAWTLPGGALNHGEPPRVEPNGKSKKSWVCVSR